MVIYGVISGAAIGELFIAGILPGVIMGVGMMALVVFISRRRGYDQKRERAGALEIWKAFIESGPSLLLPVIILGGIWGGIFSPTEAAAVAVFYSLFLGIAAHREFSVRQLPKILRQSASSTASIMIIVAAASLYGWLISVEQIPQAIKQALLSVTDSQIVLMLIINLILLVMGMFMELIAVLTIAVPVFLPVMTAVGVDPVYFGVVAVLNLMIGLLTPPFGINIFILQKISGVTFGAIVRDLFPFIIVLLGTLALMVLFPDLVMFLPRVLK